MMPTELLEPVLAATPWPTNAHLIEDAARLGYLRRQWMILDPTYGRGNFWTRWKPDYLVAHDIKLDGFDFRDLPYDDGFFDAVVFDPPYKLNGRPTQEVDEPYGVDIPATIAERHQLMLDGLDECARLTRPRGYLLMKCQDQVASGRVHWQTHMMTERAKKHGLRLVDAFLMLTTPRPQRSQVHARRNYSTLLVFR